MIVLLEGDELERVYAVAHERQAENEARGLAGRYDGPARGSEALRCHIVGAAGEAAVAKVFGIPWSKGNYREPDVGWLQVRTRWKPPAGLIVNEPDDPADVFVNAYAVSRPRGHRGRRYPLEVIVLGWMRGVEAKVDAHRCTWLRRGGYFVRASSLRPLETMCRTCLGYGWVYHDPDRDSADGCPTCTPRGGCGGTGEITPAPIDTRINASA